VRVRIISESRLETVFRLQHEQDGEKSRHVAQERGRETRQKDFERRAATVARVVGSI
jgi:hypothetical protein